MKKQLVRGKKSVLFIDTGDNCRCPLAVGYLQKLLNQKGIDYIDVRHAGVMTPNDLLPTPEVVQLLQDEGVDIRRHRSRPLTKEMILQADLILGMTPIHVQRCIRETEEARGKTFLLKEYIGVTGKQVQIPDPMGGTMEIYKKCFNDIRQSLQKFVEMPFVAEAPEPVEAPAVNTGPKAKPVEPSPSELKEKAAAQARREQKARDKANQADAPKAKSSATKEKAGSKGKAAPKEKATDKKPASAEPKDAKKKAAATPKAEGDKPSKKAVAPAKAAPKQAKAAADKPGAKKAAAGTSAAKGASKAKAPSSKKTK